MSIGLGTLCVGPFCVYKKMSNKNTANNFLVQGIQKCLNGGMDTKATGLEVRTKWADGTPAHYHSMGGTVVEYDIENGDLPINTLRKFPMDKAIAEIRWIYQKQTNSLEVAKELGIGWWDSWAVQGGTIGTRYGATVRKHNLMGNLIDTFIKDPLSRRKIMSLWQEDDFKDSDGLKPCAHTTTWGLVVDEFGDYKVSLTLNQRSMDLLITSSINAFQYYVLGEALMAHLRHETGKPYKLVKLTHIIDDVHLYDRHVPAAVEILDRWKDVSYTPIYESFELKEAPRIIADWMEWSEDDFVWEGPKIPKLVNPLELAI